LSEERLNAASFSAEWGNFASEASLHEIVPLGPISPTSVKLTDG